MIFRHGQSIILINANDFVRLTINANLLLNPVDSPLIFDRLMFNAGEIYQLALTDRDEFFNGSYINSDLNIYEVNQLSVPLSWPFNYGHTTPLNETGSSYSSLIISYQILRVRAFAPHKLSSHSHRFG
jgi:hypothetical protein